MRVLSLTQDVDLVEVLYAWLPLRAFGLVALF